MQGVCCECQSVHPVRPARRRDDLDLDIDEDNDLGPVGDYVMDIHDFYGSHCDGSGEMPQALVKEKI
jgi:hypothetical protein